ncbi:MAG: hypothetical protein ACLPYS_06230 [Vulcanimicrobiaceae bacterium]
MKLRAPFVPLTVAVLALTACGGGGSSSAPSMLNAGQAAGTATMTSTEEPANSVNRTTTLLDTDTGVAVMDADDSNPILPVLTQNRTIGSTIVKGEQNPYGLDVAKSDSGPIRAGDLVICNFNDSANVQGTGSTILALHPVVGSTPTFIAQDPSLVGCNALALSPNDVSWAAAYSANDNPLVSAAGRVVTTLLFGPWHGPFGETFSPHKGPFGKAAFYVSNAGDGSIIRVNILSAGGFSYDVIATGFAINGGAPGSILGPSGLQYDAKNDNLYVVDGADNSFTLFKHVSTIPPGGLFSKNGTFGGPFHNRARRIFSGSPLDGPISSALLPNGHVVLGNTLNPPGFNIMVEISPSRGKVVATKNVDTGAAGALFGIVATGSSDDDVQLFYNDDNTNTLNVLRR